MMLRKQYQGYCINSEKDSCPAIRDSQIDVGALLCACVLVCGGDPSFWSATTAWDLLISKVLPQELFIFSVFSLIAGMVSDIHCYFSNNNDCIIFHIFTNSLLHNIFMILFKCRCEFGNFCGAQV